MSGAILNEKSSKELMLTFVKRLLGIKRSTNNSMMYAELGRVLLRANRLFYMIRYWHRIIKTNNCILKACYSYQYEYVEIYNEHNWAYHVKQDLFMLGFGELWINQHIDDKDLSVIKQRLLDQSQQLIRSQISASPKCTYYKYLIDVYSLQYYLSKFIPVHLRKCITKFHLSSHNLAIETGRYSTTDRSKRTRFSCVDEIEDEYHFILVCPLYHSLRKQYIKPYYWKIPSVYKLIKLLQINNIKQLRQFGKYLYSATNLRNIFT